MRNRNDSLYGEDLRRVKPKPVFILGLHRSGTTFLYRALASAFSVANLTAYHVVQYDRLLFNHHKGTAAAAERDLDGLFRSWQMDTRGIDDIALSHAMPEEYGWLLRRFAGAFHANSKTVPLIDEICRKLHILVPSAEAVLLKNPYDAGHAGDLLAYFPDARFVFIERDPVAIVNSQFRVAKSSGSAKNQYVDLLLSGIPLGRTWMWFQRAMRRVVGECWHGRIALGYVQHNVARELRVLEASWNAVPTGQRVALEYLELMRDTDGAVEKVAQSLGLSPRSSPIRVEPKLREQTLLPEVKAAEAGFRNRLKKKGIAQHPLDAL